MKNSPYKMHNLFRVLNSSVILSAILKEHGMLSVPANSFDDLLNKVQMWPNDYLTQNDGEGHMAIYYNKENDTIEFQLGRSKDGIERKNGTNYMCMRNSAVFGYVNHDSPRYKH